MNSIQHLLRDESGQDMVEYALLAGFISITSLAAIRLIGLPMVVLWNVINVAIRGVPAA